jgi:hypothetical protein
MLLFFAILSWAIAIAGLTALAIFLPLTWVHLRDRHPDTLAALGPAGLLGGAGLAWLLGGRYRTLRDRNLDGLATPARLSWLVIGFGLAMGALLWILDLTLS